MDTFIVLTSFQREVEAENAGEAILKVGDEFRRLFGDDHGAIAMSAERKDIVLRAQKAVGYPLTPEI